MPLNPKLSNLMASLAADAVCAELDDGYLRIYTGPQPIDADTPIGAQVLLAELRWNLDAFAPAVNGVAAANPITADPSAAASGTAAWFRALSADGATVAFDGSVGTAGNNLNLNSTAISAGAEVSVGAYSYTQKKV